MKKSVLIPLLVLAGFLPSCGKTNLKSLVTGKIDCFSISVTNGGTKVFSAEYNSSYNGVYEYKNKEGKSIFVNTHLVGGSYYQETREEAEIHVFESRYKEQYSIYTFYSFIGWLTVEYNYYYNLDKNIIDCETKWSQYLYEKSPGEEKGDNEKAYRCAKEGYFYIRANSYPGHPVMLPEDSTSGNPYYTLKKDREESSLERHSYIRIGKENMVSYKEKWFRSKR